MLHPDLRQLVDLLAVQMRAHDVSDLHIDLTSTSERISASSHRYVTPANDASDTDEKAAG